MPLATACTNEQKVPVQVVPTTESGNPTTLDGPITVTVSSGDGTVEMIDALNFFAVSGVNLGDTVYQVSGDADLGAGVVTIQDAVTLSVTSAQAATLGLTAGAPVPK